MWWHAEWQSHFPNTEVTFRNQYGQIKERRADVVISDFKRILEIQHSLIDAGEVANRNKDYALHGHAVVWIIHAQDKIVVKNMGGRRILSFTSMTWLYEHFLSHFPVIFDILMSIGALEFGQLIILILYLGIKFYCN